MISEQDPFVVGGLPDLLHEKIFELVNYGDMVTFASLNAANFEMIETVGRFIKPTKMDITIEQTVHTITVSGGGRRPFSWSAYIPKNAPAIMGPLEDVVLGKLKMSALCVDGNYQMVQSGTLAELFGMIEALQTLFHCPIDVVTCNPRYDVNLMALLASPFFQSPRKFIMGEMALMRDELEYLLTHLKTGHLELKATPVLRFDTRQELSYSKVEIHHSEWVTFDNLVQMMSVAKRVTLWHSRLTGKDINAAFKRWQRSTWPLEVLVISRRITLPTGPRPAMPAARNLLKSIKTSQGKKYKGSATYFNPTTSYEQGLDFQRTDGVTATMLAKLNDDCEQEITLTVWHDPKCLVPLP